MYGAILGDMIGAPYEFDRGDKTKKFPLFVEDSQFTDDTVMTVAVAEALLDTLGGTEEETKTALVRSMRKWGRAYPNAGYGNRFGMWLFLYDTEKDAVPYHSFGNGSAMRVCAAGWLSDTLEGTRRLARLSAEVTHDHPEGIKGAESVASASSSPGTGTARRKSRSTSSGSSATTFPALAMRFARTTTTWRPARRPSRRPSPPFWRALTSRT